MKIFASLGLLLIVPGCSDSFASRSIDDKPSTGYPGIPRTAEGRGRGNRKAKLAPEYPPEVSFKLLNLRQQGAKKGAGAADATALLTAAQDDDQFLIACNAAARAHITDARDVLKQQSTQREDARANFGALVAWARIDSKIATDALPQADRAAARVKEFLVRLDMTAAAIMEQIKQKPTFQLHAPEWSKESMAIQSIADMAYVDRDEGILKAGVASGLDFSADHVANMRAKLTLLSEKERGDILIQDLATCKYLGPDRAKTMVMLAEIGEPAAESIRQTLRDWLKTPADHKYIQYAALFHALSYTGDQSALPLLKQFLTHSEPWVVYYAQQVIDTINRNGAQIGWTEI